ITPQTPPTVTIHGDTDLVVPYQQAEQLHQLLEKQGVSHKLVPIKGGGHGGFTPRQWSYSYNEMFAFIDRYTQ
ncbi:MAG: S9 family peptidase, partial [Porticoccaceae bacterium]|nr:S9 family peptidase [Porticoccaceae bacterium]